MNFREYIKNNRVLYDGAFSTYYAEINGKCLVPEMANIKDRETVLKIHKEYVDAGAVLIQFLYPLYLPFPELSTCR